ncbi:MAG: hypothetical protein U1E76_07455 [Planctomycetota bacterium]
MLVSLALLTCTTLALPQTPASDLGAAIKKTFEKKAYSFEMKVTMEGMPDFGGAGGGGGADRPPVKGDVTADGPIHLVAGEIEAFKDGDKLIVKEGSEWKALEMPARGGRGGGQGQGGGGQGQGGAQGGGGQGQGGEGGRGGRGGGGQGGGMNRGAFMLRTVAAPHTMLDGIDKKVEGLKVADEGGAKVFTGNLTADAAKELAGRFNRMRGGEDNRKVTGAIKLWVGAAGRVDKYEVTTSTEAGQSGREIKTTRAVTLHDSGDSKVAVPEEVKKLLAQPVKSGEQQGAKGEH